MGRRLSPLCIALLPPPLPHTKSPRHTDSFTPAHHSTQRARTDTATQQQQLTRHANTQRYGPDNKQQAWRPGPATAIAAPSTKHSSAAAAVCLQEQGQQTQLQSVIRVQRQNQEQQQTQQRNSASSSCTSTRIINRKGRAWNNIREWSCCQGERGDATAAAAAADTV